MLKLTKLPNLPFPALCERDASDKATQTTEGFLSWARDNREALRKECMTHGAVLFRGFPLDTPEQFQEFARIFCPSLAKYTGGDSPRTNVSGAVYTSTEFPKELSISMHNEMSYTNSYPRSILFYCDIPAQKQGETPLADCRKLLKRLPKDLVERFAAKKVTYIQNLHAGMGLGKSWMATFETTDKAAVEAILKKRNAVFEWKEDGGLRVSETVDQVVTHPDTGEKVFFTQAHQWHYSELDKETQESLLAIMDEKDMYHACTYGDGSPIDVKDLDAIRAAYTAESVAFKWEKRDVVLVDNILVAHGRNPFEGPRRILVAFG